MFTGCRPAAFPGVLGVCLGIGIVLAPASASEITFVEASNDRIQTAHENFSHINTLVTGLVDPVAVAVDLDSNTMYWTDLGLGKIQRASLDGAGVQDVVVGGAPMWIALDLVAGKLYWTDFTARTIRRANLDGSSAEDLLFVPPGTLPGGLTGIALDPVQGKLYFGDQSNNRIQRANLDGSGVEDFVTAAQMGPMQMTVDVEGGYLYWADPL